MNPAAKPEQVAGDISHDSRYFLCCTDKVGLRLVSLQQAHALRMILPEREKRKTEGGGREGGAALDRRSNDAAGRDGQHRSEARPNVWRGVRMNYEFGWIWGKLC